MKTYRLILIIFGLLLLSGPLSAQDLHPQGILQNGLYYAPQGNIIVSGVSTSVEPNRNVLFVARDAVILQDGFHAKPGGIFTARVADSADSDQDGISDWWETYYGLNPNNAADANLDQDGDGLTNLQEFQGQTNPVVYEKPRITLTAAPQSIIKGSSFTLTWDTSFAATCQIEPGLGSVSVDGSRVLTPLDTTTYILTATGPGGTTVQSVSVQVIPPVPQILYFKANPLEITAGQSATLSWKTNAATQVTIDQGIGSVALEGQITVTPANTTTYTLTAAGPGGASTGTVSVAVFYPPPKIGFFRAQPVVIDPGQSSTLTWTSQGGQSAGIEPGIGPVALNDSVTVTPTQTTIYTLTVSNQGGTVSAHVTVGDYTDADLDGLPDAWEIAYFGHIFKYTAQDDADGDLLTNLVEFNQGKDPMIYNAEDLVLSGPLQNGKYCSGGRIIVQPDCSVGANINVELKANCEILIHPEFRALPGAMVKLKPGDCDWLPDEWELAKFGTLKYGNDDDPDQDGLTNYEEYLIGGDPNQYDQDNDDDGLKDKWELEHFGNLNQDKYGDYDQDGISNYLEYLAGSDPTKWDSRPKPGNYYEYDNLGRIKRIIKIK